MRVMRPTWRVLGCWGRVTSGSWGIVCWVIVSFICQRKWSRTSMETLHDLLLALLRIWPSTLATANLAEDCLPMVLRRLMGFLSFLPSWDSRGPFPAHRCWCTPGHMGQGLELHLHAATSYQSTITTASCRELFWGVKRRCRGLGWWGWGWGVICFTLLCYIF